MTTGFIFLALAIAWAAYLIPKALSHHEDAERTRAEERLAESSRVVARREAVNARSSVLISGVGGAQAAPELLRARREVMSRATKRRRNVLATLVLAVAAVAGFAGFAVINWWWVSAPVALLATWLIACRLMVRSERRAWDSMIIDDDDDEESTESTGLTGAVPITITAVGDVAEEPLADGLWAPVAVTLPTYVDAAVARRTIRPIDLDSTGVWTSGRTRESAEIAREADAFRAAAAAADLDLQQRAVNS